MNDADDMARVLHELADDEDLRDIPFAAITARIGRRRRRMQMMVGAAAVVAVVGTVLTVDGVVRRSQVASAPSVSTTAVTGPTPTTAGTSSGPTAVTAPAVPASEWPLRGALSSRRDLLQQSTERGLAEAARYPGPDVTGRALFLGDTAAGRIPVVLVSSAAGDPPGW